MSTSRRKFLQTSGLSIAALALGSHKLFANPISSAYLAVQLYTVREDMGKDPSGTLKKISDMGYKYVEHAGYGDRKFYGYKPVEFKKLLDGYGIKMPSGHVVMHADDYSFAKKKIFQINGNIPCSMQQRQASPTLYLPGWMKV